MKILFLTRVYPPSVGGMETFSFNLIKNFKSINKNTFVIANTKGKKFLPIFIFVACFKSLLFIYKNRIEYLHLSDGILSPIGFLLKKITGVKTIVTIHGLDITYPNKLYQQIIPFFLKKLDKIICVSSHTKNECVKRGILESKCEVIPNGVNPNQYQLNGNKKDLRNKLSKKIKINLDGKLVLLTVGRLIKRKGVNWFINNVFGKLPEHTIYLVSGDGPERETIEKSVKRNNCENRILLLGRTSDSVLKLLYNSADVFVMPNITIKGDMEGFGIVILEAGSAGLPVVASKIEGIQDAVLSAKTGWLVEEKNAKSFIDKIFNINLRKEGVRQETVNNFSWEKIALSYKDVFSRL